MALTPEGTPYVESTDLVANYPAASLSLANRVDLVGVLPFATSAARATAIPSPTDGQYSYLQDTNSTEFWNGSAWVAAGVTPGLRIMTATSIVNTGGTATQTGGKIDFSAVTNLSINGVFTSSFDNYLIVIDYEASANGQLKARMRAAGTDNTGANTYIDNVLQVNNATLTAGRTTADKFDDFFMSRTENRQGSALHLFAPFLARFTQYEQTQHYSVGEAGIGISAGVHKVASSFDGITLFPGSGTVTGTLRIYGYLNS